MLTSLDGKSALVTGASKGIGKGIARVFARHGASVMVVARHIDAAEATAKQIRDAGGRAAAVAADVRDLASMEAAAAAANPVIRRIDDFPCRPAARLVGNGLGSITNGVRGPARRRDLAHGAGKFTDGVDRAIDVPALPSSRPQEIEHRCLRQHGLGDAVAPGAGALLDRLRGLQIGAEVTRALAAVAAPEAAAPAVATFRLDHFVVVKRRPERAGASAPGL